MVVLSCTVLLHYGHVCGCSVWLGSQVLSHLQCSILTVDSELLSSLSILELGHLCFIHISSAK